MKTLLLFCILIFISSVTSRKSKFKNRALNKTKKDTNLETFTTVLPLRNIFRNKNNTYERGQMGSTATLHCYIIDASANITVMWKKVNSEDIITRDNVTISDDKRFLAKNQEDTNRWKLLIRYAKPSDKGKYECVVKGELQSSLHVNLNLTQAEAKILGGNTKQVKTGSPLRLSCLLLHSIEAPSYIFWYKNDRVINYDMTDGATIRQGRLGIELIFPRAESNDSGNYSCVPSNALQASVIVEVL